MNEVDINIATLSRLKNAIVSDKHFKPEKLCNIIKSDIFMTLTEYAEIRADDFNISITVNDFGEYVINICAIARKLKTIGLVADKL